jgi:hypothetical protein
VDALANPSLQSSLHVVLAAIAAVGAATFVGVLITARRPLAPSTRVFLRRAGAVGLFVAAAAVAALALLAMPVDSGLGARPAEVVAPSEADGARPAGDDDDGVSARRSSSARLPGLSLDAPEGWTLEADKAGHKLTVSSDKAKARLLVSTALLNEAVDVQALLRRLADTQRELGFEIGPTFSDRIGDLPAAGFLATGPTRSICTWMVRRDAHLVSSAICTADGQVTARDACRAPLSRLRWRAQGR